MQQTLCIPTCKGSDWQRMGFTCSLSLCAFLYLINNTSRHHKHLHTVVGSFPNQAEKWDIGGLSGDVMVCVHSRLRHKRWLVVILDHHVCYRHVGVRVYNHGGTSVCLGTTLNRLTSIFSTYAPYIIQLLAST